MMTRIVVLTGIATALLVAIWMVYRLGHEHGQHEVQAQWSRQRETDAELTARMTAHFREVERGMQAHNQELRRKHEQQIADLERRHNLALDLLRKRPIRPVDYVPAPAEAAESGAVAGCGGDRLFRDDGEFLARLARDADVVKESLTQCREQYEGARAAINGLSAGPPAE